MMRWHDRMMPLDAFHRNLRLGSQERWLSPAEAELATEFRSAKHRDRWLAGRWLAKQVLSEAIPNNHFSASDLHIQTRNERGRGTRPRVFAQGRLQPWSVSISHSNTSIYAVASTCSDIRVGVDIMELSTTSSSVADFWFTPAERQWCRQSQDRHSTSLIWSLKEARYKAENQGEPFIPLQVDTVNGTPLQHHTDFLPGEQSEFRLDWDNLTLVSRRTSQIVSNLIVANMSHPG